MLICEQVGHFGCVVNAGINSFFAGLAGSLPNTTFAQNNGVLALTRCASRSAGYSCGIWLFLFGVLAKVRIPYRNRLYMQWACRVLGSYRSCTHLYAHMIAYTLARARARASLGLEWQGLAALDGCNLALKTALFVLLWML